MLNALPKQLTKRKILNPNGQRDIHESICQSTLGLLQPQMGLLRQQLELYVKQMALKLNRNLKVLKLIFKRK